jgi:hypothetical protein
VSGAQLAPQALGTSASTHSGLIIVATALLNTLLALNIQIGRFPRAIPKELEAAIALNIREISQGKTPVPLPKALAISRRL